MPTDVVPFDDNQWPVEYDADLIDAVHYMLDALTSGERLRESFGPPPGDMRALLAQAEWWRPRVGPPVRVVDMTDTHRLHTARHVLNRATSVMGMSPEAVKASPLFGALLVGLPHPNASGWDDLLERATHWSTCPRNRDLTAPACAPDCRPRTRAWNRPRELAVDYNGDAAGADGL